MSPQSDRFRVLRRLPEIRFEEELRGYSKSQVDRVLETLAPMADEVEELQRRLAEAETRAASAEARLVERGDAPPPPSAKPAPPPPPQQTGQAPPAAQTPSDFDETLRNTLLLAQRTADATVKEATEEAERLRSSAAAEADELLNARRQEAESIQADNAAERTKLAADVDAERARLLADAKQEVTAKLEAIEAELVDAHDSKRTELLEQIAELEIARDLLATDVDNFEGHLSARRESIRDALADISDVLDDPTRLRPAMPPARSETAAIDAGDYPPIAVDVPGLSALDATAPRPAAPGADGAVSADDLQIADVDDAVPSAPTTGQVPQISSEASGIILGEVGDSLAPDSVEPNPEAAGPATETLAVVPDIEDPAPASEPVDANGDPSPDGARPAWADAVPAADEDSAPDEPTTDPFLDELRRVTNESDAEDDELARFLENEDASEGKSTWFGRRR